MDMGKVKDLDGKILAILSNQEINLLRTAHETGRKHQINVNITINNVQVTDLTHQIRAVSLDDRNAPIWLENAYISISSATEH